MIAEKRAYLVERLEQHDKARQGMVADIEALDRALALCGEVKVKPVPMFPKGRLRRLVGEVRRESEIELSRSELTRAIMNKLGMDPDDRKQFVVIRQKVKDCLNSVRANLLRTKRRNAVRIGKEQGEWRQA